MRLSFLLNVALILVLCAGARACEPVLTTEEIAAGSPRAYKFADPTAPSVEMGTTVNSAGDLNGDGFDDLVLAAPNWQIDVGLVYIVFGRSAEAWANANFNSTSDPASWISISGALTSTRLGCFGVEHGDFNGDGVSDIVIGSQTVGKAFIVFGRAGTWASFSTEDIGSSAAPGFVIKGDGSTMHVGNAGDMNGDGIEDLLVTEQATSSAYVVFGVAGENRSTFNLSTIDGENGFVLTDGTNIIAGELGSAGDVDGDGLADLALGSNTANDNAGRVYIVFARNVSATGLPWAASFNLTSELDGTNGFIVEGPVTDSRLGWSVVGAGDVNCDGFADLFIGTGNSASGSWILFGHAAPWISPLNASLLDGSNGFRFTSQSVTDFWGNSGGGVGDVNGDGIDDVIIGGFNAYRSTGLQTGAAAIIFGHNGSWPAEIDHDNVVGSVGFLVDGPDEGSRFGYSARGAGDVNGDGISDFVVGAPYFSSKTGYAALVFGVADHCAVCSNTTEDCLVCDDGFILNGTVCKEPPTPSSSHFSGSSSTNSDLTSLASSAAASGSTAVVVIETGGGGTVGEVAAEIAQLLGVDVGQISVIEITPGTFEVTVINEEVAQQLVTLIEQCIEDGVSDLQLMN